MISARVVRESRLHLYPIKEFVSKVCCCGTGDDAISEYLVVGIQLLWLLLVS
jgi:hypothetical protein